MHSWPLRQDRRLTSRDIFPDASAIAHIRALPAYFQAGSRTTAMPANDSDSSQDATVDPLVPQRRQTPPLQLVRFCASAAWRASCAENCLCLDEVVSAPRAARTARRRRSFVAEDAGDEGSSLQALNGRIGRSQVRQDRQAWVFCRATDRFVGRRPTAVLSLSGLYRWAMGTLSECSTFETPERQRHKE